MSQDPLDTRRQEVDPVRARQASSSPYNFVVLTVSMFLAVVAAILLYVYFYA